MYMDLVIVFASVECVGSGNLCWVLMNDLHLLVFVLVICLGLLAALKEKRKKNYH